MKKSELFIKSKLTLSEEEAYLNDTFDKYYEKKLKQEYSNKLEREHGLRRDVEDGTSALNKSNLKKAYMAVLSAAALLIIGFLIWPSLNSHNDLSTEVNAFIHNDFYTNKNIKRGDTNANEALDLAIIAYNKKDFSTAIANFNRIDSPSEETKFFMAMSLMYNGKYNDAALLFDQLSAIEQFKYTEEVKWFSALTYVKNNQLEKAKVTLSEIKNWKFKEAQIILKSIK